MWMTRTSSAGGRGPFLCPSQRLRAISCWKAVSFHFGFPLLRRMRFSKAALRTYLHTRESYPGICTETDAQSSGAKVPMIWCARERPTPSSFEIIRQLSQSVQSRKKSSSVSTVKKIPESKDRPPSKLAGSRERGALRLRSRRSALSRRGRYALQASRASRPLRSVPHARSLLGRPTPQRPAAGSRGPRLRPVKPKNP